MKHHCRSGLSLVHPASFFDFYFLYFRPVSIFQPAISFFLISPAIQIIFSFLDVLKRHVGIRFYICDMLPPLKSQILKWGLLAQWLYWAKYLQAILACPAILFARTRVYFLTYCPDMDSLYCQHPSCLFTDIDRCISISVHLISTRAAVYSFR